NQTSGFTLSLLFIITRLRISTDVRRSAGQKDPPKLSGVVSTHFEWFLFSSLLGAKRLHHHSRTLPCGKTVRSSFVDSGVSRRLRAAQSGGHPSMGTRSSGRCPLAGG